MDVPVWLAEALIAIAIGFVLIVLLIQIFSYLNKDN